MRWPLLASRSAPKGTVEISVSDARGAALRPPVTVSSAGNALLLDYDRLSGDLLLLSVGPRCLTRRDYRANRCRESLLRVRPDGSVRSTLTVDPYTSISYVGAARFIADGPDADATADVVLTVGSRGIALIESARTGALESETVPVATITGTAIPFYRELRLIPVIEPSGARRLTVALPETPSTDRYLYQSAGNVPAEIVWK